MRGILRLKGKSWKDKDHLHPIPLQPLSELGQTTWILLERQKEHLGKSDSSTLVTYLPLMSNLHCKRWGTEHSPRKRAGSLHRQHTARPEWWCHELCQGTAANAALHTQFPVLLGGQTQGTQCLPKQYYSAANAMWGYLIYWLKFRKKKNNKKTNNKPSKKRISISQCDIIWKLLPYTKPQQEWTFSFH